MKNDLLISQKFQIILLALLWAGVQVFVYLQFGVTEQIDTAAYIADARDIVEGNVPEQRNFWYAGYSLLLAIILFFNGSPVDIVWLQILFSGITAIAIYRFVKSLSGSNATSFIATFLFIAWIKIHQWNTIVYTDALFTYMAVVSLAALHFSRKSWHYLGVALLVVFTFFIRPTGIGFLAAMAGYMLFVMKDKIKLQAFPLILIGVGVSIAFLVLLNLVLKDYVPDILNSYEKAEIIYPNIPLWIEKPDGLVMPDSHYPPILQLLLFVTYNPIYFIKITLLKGALFLGNVKPYFSIFHNAAIITFLYPLYFFSFYGIRKMPLSAEKIYIIVFMVFTTLTVSLTSENWDGRFLIPMLPYVFITAVLGISYFFKWRIFHS